MYSNSSYRQNRLDPYNSEVPRDDDVRESVSVNRGHRDDGYRSHRRGRYRSYSRDRNRKDHDRYRHNSRDVDRYRSRSRHRSRSRKRNNPEDDGLLLNRDISESHARSRAAERRRRKAQAECIRRAGGFQKLADQEGHQTVRLFWDGFQWIAKTGQTTILGGDPALMNSTRKLRRLYFGNLPIHMGLTESGFQNLVWNEMRNRNFCNDPNVSPVLYVWFAKDKGNYGFVEFATVEETERALTMDGMNCMGVQVRVSRPNDYSATTMKNVTQQQPQASVPTVSDPMYALSDTFKGTCLRLVQVVVPESIEDELEYLDVLDDVREEFEKHGKTKSSAIIFPKHKELYKDFEVGDILLEFVDNEALLSSVQNMSGRKYENRPIEMRPFDEHIYNSIVNDIIKDIEQMDK